MFWFIKVTIFYAITLITTILALTAGAILAPFVAFKIRYQVIIIWSKVFILLSQKLLGISYKVYGIEHLEANNKIITCNHQSMWETIFMQTLLPYQTWVVKKQLLYIPFWGWGLKLLQPISIDREKRQQLTQFITKAKQMLNLGRKVVIYPEGTRVKPGKIAKFKRGAAILAYESGYSITPIVLNSGDFWPKGFWPRKSGCVKVIIGPSISPENMGVATINDKLYQWSLDNYNKILHHDFKA